MKIHLVWIPKYRKPGLTGAAARRARDVLRHIALEHEIELITGKASSDHIHGLIAFRPTETISKIMLWLNSLLPKVGIQREAHKK